MPRNFGLDILRAFSIWLVMLQHAGINIPGMAPLKIGAIGVEIFFVLSGFLIGGILFRDLSRQRPAFETLRTFWIRRWFRILPLYYAVILVKFAFFDHSPGWNILYYFSFLQNNFYGINFFPVSWSLVVEEWFYIFAPLFLLVCRRLFPGSGKMMLALLSFIIAENIFRFSYVILRDVPFQGITANFPFRFDSLFLGVILAYLRHNGLPLYKQLSSGITFAAGSVCFFGYLFLFHHWNELPGGVDHMIVPRTLGFFFLSLSIALMVPFAARLEDIRRTGAGWKAVHYFITQTSVLTYAIYLIHTFTFEVTLKNKITENHSLNFALAILLTYTCAFLIYNFFEKPFLNLREVLVRKKK